jgi:heme oxygenase
MASVDWTKPLATLLRESTYDAHETVARSPGATTLLSGKLAHDEYVRYLMMLWHVYEYVLFLRFFRIGR